MKTGRKPHKPSLAENYDGIRISDKPTWEHSAKELWAILGKRLIALPSKLLGFKPFVLYTATWLLVMDKIRDWIWFCVGIIILGLVWGFVARRNKEKEILEYAEMQTELQTLWTDYRKRPLDEFLDDPAVRGAVDGASADYERKRDKLLQRFRSRITD